MDLSKQKISLNDPMTRTVLIMLAVAAGIFFVCQKVIIQPHKRKISELQQRLEHIKLQDQTGKIYKKVIGLEKQLPQSKDPAWLRVKITDFAKQTDIHIISTEPLPVKKIPPYSYISLNINLDCTFTQLLRFINLIESNPQFIAIESVNMQPKTDYKLELTEEEKETEAETTSAPTEVIIGTLY